VRRYTAAEARALREAATPGPWRSAWNEPDDFDGPMIAGATGGVVVELWWDGPRTACAEPDAALIAAAPDLAATVEALEAELAEARLCLLAEAGDPAGAVGLHPGWVHRAVGWCLVLEVGEIPVVAVHRERPIMGEGACFIAWTQDLTRLRWTPINADLTDPQPGDVVRATDADGGVGAWLVLAREGDLVSWFGWVSAWDCDGMRNTETIAEWADWTEWTDVAVPS
jgi:hypothetical protein